VLDSTPRRDIKYHAFTVTVFPDTYARTIVDIPDLSLPALAEIIRQTGGAEKGRLPWLKLAVFGAERSERGCLRTNKNLIEITGVEGDADSGTLSFDDAVALMRETKIRSLIYTTASHVPVTKERWRVLAPVSENQPPSRRFSLVARLNGALRGTLADESFNLSLSYYFGKVGDNPNHRVEVIDGDFIDCRDDLDATAIGKKEGDGAGPPKTGSHGQDAIGRTDDEIMELVQQSRQLTRHGERQWHLRMLEATASMVGKDWTNAEIYDATADYCDRGWGDPDIEVMVRGARLKWERPDPAEELSTRLGKDICELLYGAEAGAKAGASSTGAKTGAAPGKPRLAATPYIWTDPAKLPQRNWLYGRLLIRRFVSMSVAPGGTGKSTLIATEALAQVSGRDLIGVTPSGRLRVWCWNLEDPQEETARKVQAAAKHYGLGPEDIGDRLFVDSGRDQKLVIATMNKDGPTIVRPVVDALIEEVIAKQIDVIVIDPFVSCHETPENDNNAADRIVKEWAAVADRRNCAVHLVDHTRKAPAGTEVTTDSARGGKAKTDGARVVRVVNQMSAAEGEKAGVPNHRLYFRTYNDKGNLAPPAETSEWFELESVNLGNGPAIGLGDSVGVAVRWEWPDPLEGVGNFNVVAAEIRAGVWRENSQCTDWVGVPVAKALGLDLGDKAARNKVRGLIRVWTGIGRLVTVARKDNHREDRKFIEVAPAEG
jgi:hypothetical protein